MEAFSDGVLAIILTIMVLELQLPKGDTWEALRPLGPMLLSYALSFTFISIYWVNHHHMFHAVQKVDGLSLWLNLHLLFWLSLTPFGTGWLAQTNFATLPVAAYGGILLMSGLAYYFLATHLARLHGPESELAKAIGKDFKGKISVLIYAAALPVAFYNAWLAYGFYVFVAMIWFVPDSRIERRLDSHPLHEKKREKQGDGRGH
jgi:uncharacterized membrane protein